MIYLTLFLTFLKIGAFTFGGGYAMLPLIQQEVSSHGWLTMRQLVDFIAVSESTPGPFAVNISTYVGFKTAGLLGSACSTLGVILPSFIIILIIARAYNKFRDNTAVTGIMSGLSPAVVGLISASILSVGQSVFFPKSFTLTSGTLASAIICLMMSILIFKKVHPILLIILSAVIGIILGFATGGQILGI